MLEWFHNNGVSYVSSFPKVELFDPGSKRIFRPRSVAAWRNGAVAHGLVQLSWVLTQNAGGGYFVLVGQKQP